VLRDLRRLLLMRHDVGEVHTLLPGQARSPAYLSHTATETGRNLQYELLAMERARDLSGTVEREAVDVVIAGIEHVRVCVYLYIQADSIFTHQRAREQLAPGRGHIGEPQSTEDVLLGRGRDELQARRAPRADCTIEPSLVQPVAARLSVPAHVLIER